MDVFSPVYLILYPLLFMSSVYGKTKDDVRSPFGVRICTDLCLHLANCLSPTFNAKDMTCNLTSDGHGQTGDFKLTLIKNTTSEQRVCQSYASRLILTRFKGPKCIHEKRKPIEIFATTNSTWYHYSEKTKIWKEITDVPAPRELTVDESTGRIYWIVHKRNKYKVERTFSMSNMSVEKNLYSTSECLLSIALDHEIRSIFVTAVRRNIGPAILIKITEVRKSSANYGIGPKGLRFLAINIKEKKLFGFDGSCIAVLTYTGRSLSTTTLSCPVTSLVYNNKDNSSMFLCDGVKKVFIMPGHTEHLLDPRLVTVERTIIALTEEKIILLGIEGEIYDRKLQYVQGRIPAWPDIGMPLRAVGYTSS